MIYRGYAGAGLSNNFIWKIASEINTIVTLFGMAAERHGPTCAGQRFGADSKVARQKSAQNLKINTRHILYDCAQQQKSKHGYDMLLVVLSAVAAS